MFWSSGRRRERNCSVAPTAWFSGEFGVVIISTSGNWEGSGSFVIILIDRSQEFRILRSCVKFHLKKHSCIFSLFQSTLFQNQILLPATIPLSILELSVHC